MSDIPGELRYTKTHEWVRDEGNGECTVGITQHAQHQLGDLVFVELPELEHLNAGDEAVVVESVKTAADVYAPLAGEVIAINDTLQSEPATVNHDPYGDGWLFRIKMDDQDELNRLLDANAYKAEVEDA